MTMTGRQVAALIGIIVAAFAFLDTSAPIWTGPFWLDFARHFYQRAFIAAAVAVAFGGLVNLLRRKNDGSGVT